MVVITVADVGVWRNDVAHVGIDAHGVVGVAELSDAIVSDLGFAIAPIRGSDGRVAQVEHAAFVVIFGEIAGRDIGAVIRGG